MICRVSLLQTNKCINYANDRNAMHNFALQFWRVVQNADQFPFLRAEGSVNDHFSVAAAADDH